MRSTQASLVVIFAAAVAAPIISEYEPLAKQSSLGPPWPTEATDGSFEHLCETAREDQVGIENRHCGHGSATCIVRSLDDNLHMLPAEMINGCR